MDRDSTQHSISTKQSRSLGSVQNVPPNRDRIVCFQRLVEAFFSMLRIHCCHASWRLRCEKIHLKIANYVKESKDKPQRGEVASDSTYLKWRRHSLLDRLFSSQKPGLESAAVKLKYNFALRSSSFYHLHSSLSPSSFDASSTSSR